MDRLRMLNTFIHVAEHASFAEAGRQLNMSPTTVSRAIAALEAEVGVQLLRRTTRSVRLTDEGGDFLARCRAGIAEIDGAFATARSGQTVPSGTLTVTAPVMFGRLHVLPVVAELSQRHPELQVRLLLLDRVVHLVDEGVDVAVRIADLPNSSLHMLRLGEVRRVFSASPAYLAARGRPASLADLRDHDIIWIEDEYGQHRGWGLSAVKRSGRAARFSVNNMDAAVSAAVAGLGVVRTLSYQVAGQIADGRLEPLFPGDDAPVLPISLLFQSGRKGHPNVRAFVEVARRHLRRTSL
ncbi:LysR family transcriptional regulator [Pusillimonas noertemannii]|uniref:DNA-binding transcriptional LysR family regulator n=1 Tax=Pusillimonas noertemannii TaxID=305977 RepID=A0A2U1CMP1_9BURK|nr:LysR family transcriptional regulator [Pusillimonas noertemannii]NYT68712.1 LysR family transcriptional regulator [Pusillimonas noertemannii]PVY62269.1 DNA-binding transcriptional LysR family regulator [Pusillimonas noertemannii]TFL10754.1 LysR family transcriptional regulator [Pusillimonas noertemannii]